MRKENRRIGEDDMFEEEIKHHDVLFSGSSLEIGKIHWYIQKANTEMENLQYVKQEKDGFKDVMEEVLTSFGEEVGVDEIHWWVFKKETKMKELLDRTNNVLVSAQKLKEDSLSLKNMVAPKSYEGIVGRIKEFTERDAKEIHALHDYVVWLHSRDILAPIILFTPRVWGTTRLSDRMVQITANSIEEDQQMVERCVEKALGLRGRFSYTIEEAHNSIMADIYDSLDPEEEWPTSDPVSRETLLVQTAHKVFDELATYFEFIRNSLKNIALEIEKYNDQARLLYNESFWSQFVTKALADSRVETQLWDFKTTLEMWHCPKEKKQEFEVAFAEQVSSYANSSGGALIIGITNEPPRKVVGIQNLENKMKSAKSVLDRCTSGNAGFVHFQQIRLKDESGQERDCLVIAIAQTKNVIQVKDQHGKFSCPTRQATGLHRGTYDEVLQSKTSVLYDNYNFVRNLKVFLDGR
jgi:hypothetical protein